MSWAHYHSRGSPFCLLTVLFLLVLVIVPVTHAFTVLISDADQLRQTCSGMIAGENSRIQATFEKGATGTVATMFYEFQDFDKLGKESPESDSLGYHLRTYICTDQAVKEHLCTTADLGNFIVDESQDKSSTVQLQRLDFGASDADQKTLTYNVTSKGYYCFGATVVPLTSLESTSGSETAVHAAFSGRVTFYNKFDGNLPAAEFPKLGFYFGLTALYALMGLGWLYMCMKHKDEILPVQHFISGTIAFLVIEMLAQWAYYYYMNAHQIDFFRIKEVNGRSSVTAIARFLLVLTSILDAGRNSVSFFLLLIVAMGYGVIRPSIGPVMTKVRLLTAAHFLFGVLYSIGIVLIQLDQGGAWIFAFIFPLAMTLTGFLMWIINSLKWSIEYLTQRKQTFKKSMFVRLHRILIGAVLVIFAFFVISTIAFSQSGGEGFAPNTWQYRWFLLDGWLGLLYFGVFSTIAWVWRPTGNNMRLAMSDELATDDDPNAEGYEVDVFAVPGGPDGPDSDDDEESKTTSHGGSTPANRVPQDNVVFSIGDEDDETVDQSRTMHDKTTKHETGNRHEREGLIGSQNNHSDETLVPPGKRADKND